MTEKRQILILFSSTLLLGISAFLLVIYLAGQGNHAAVSDDLNPFVNSGPFLVSVWAVLVLLLPFLFLAMYFFFGREKEPLVVPEFLSTVPDKKLSPLEVNILFSGSPFASDENGFYATLLDLHRKKKIAMTIKPDKRGVLIRVLDRRGTDPYEQRVMDFLSQFMSGNVFDSGYLAKTASEAPDNWEPLLREMDEKEKAERRKTFNRAKKIQRQLNSLMFRTDDALTRKYLYNGTWLTFPLIALGLVCLVLPLWILPTAPAGTINQPLFVMFDLTGLCLAGSVLALYSSLGKYGDDRIRMDLENLPRSSDNAEIFFHLPSSDAVIRSLKIDRPFPVIVVIVTVGVIALMTAGILVYDFTPYLFLYTCATLLAFVILIQSSVAYYYALTVFSRWNDNYYREKLEWLAFAKFLSELPGIEKYHPENLDQWGEWLVYGTALGLSEKISITATLLGLDLAYPFSNDPDFPWFGDFKTLSEFTIDKQ
jgi:hypothetical protein